MAVGVAVGAQPVGFVIEHVIAPLMLEYQIHEAFQHAVQCVPLKVWPGVIRRDVMADQLVQPGDGNVLGGEQEFHFRQRTVQAGQRHRVAGAQWQGGVQGVTPPLCDGTLVRLPAARGQLLGNQAIQFRRVRQGGGEAIAGGAFENLVQQRAGQGATGEGVDAGGEHRCCVLAGVVRKVLGQLVTARAGRRQLLLDGTQGAVTGDPPGRGRRTIDSRHRALLLRMRHGMETDVIVAGWRQDADGRAGQRRQHRAESVVGNAGVAEQQAADGALLELIGFAVAAGIGGQPQPAGVLGARQGHVQQTHVLGQPLVIGRLLHVVVGLQLDTQLAVMVVTQRRLAFHLRLEAADERQEHQRIFQALGLVDGDHPHPVVVAFQAQKGILVVATAVFQRLFQPANQRRLAVQPHGGPLQQLRQMQQVGQRPLAVQAAAEPLRHLEIQQQGTQHWQHALALPQLVIVMELVQLRFPANLVLTQIVQLRVAARQGGAGQGAVHQAIVFRVGASAQQHQQVERLRGGEHRILIGQVDAAYVALRQCLANGRRLVAVAYQYGDVAAAQWHEVAIFAETAVAFFAAIEQAGDFAGGVLRLSLLIVAAAERIAAVVIEPQRQAIRRLAVDFQHRFAALGLDRLERNAVVEQKNITVGEGRTPFEQLIDGRHHEGGGTEVAVQGVMASGGGLAGLQVSVYVGAAKSIDGLFGVADHEPAGVRLMLVKGREYPVLERVRVLEFIDQSDRELFADHLRQVRALVRAGQRAVQPCDHVVIADAGALVARFFHTMADPAGGVPQQSGAGQRLAGAALQSLCESFGSLQGRRFTLFGEPQASAGEAPQSFLFLVGHRQTGGVAGQNSEHAGEAIRFVAALVEPATGQRLLDPDAQLGQLAGQHGAGLLFPFMLGGELVQPGLQDLRQGFAVLRQGKQWCGSFQQRLRRAEAGLAQQWRGDVGKRGDHRAPVIAGGLVLFIAAVLFQLQAEQAAGVEGVLLEHAVAETVDSVDGGFVHPLRGQLELVGRGLALACVGVVRHQRGKNRVLVGLLVAGKNPGGFRQPVADAFAQFLGGGFGEGDYQNLRR